MRHSFGILDSAFKGQIPGTSIITADRNATSTTVQAIESSHRRESVILVPQPTNDPNDPLNWSKIEKRVVLLTIAIASAIIHALGPMMSTSYLQIARQFNESLDKITQTVSGNFALTAGLGTVLVSAFGICYGKRPALVFSAVSVSALTLWIALEKNFVRFAVVRALQGLATAPLEVLVTGTVADLYFVHERGTAMAVVGTMMLLSVLLSQIMGGFAVQYLGFRSLFYITAILIGLLVPALFFLVPETAWNRNDTRQNIPLQNLSTVTEIAALRVAVTSNEEASDKSGSEPKNHTQRVLASTRCLGAGATCEKNCAMANTDAHGGGPDDLKKRKPYSARLRLWNGRIDDQSYWLACVRPLLLLYHPAVIFGIFVHGLGSTYLHAFAFAKLRLFSAPPYNLTPSQIGLTVLPGAATGILGQVLSGVLSDYVAQKLARKSNGVYEAEFRLLLMIPQTIFAVVGFCGFGITVSRGQPLWIVLLFFSCVTFSVPFGSLASLTYLVDSVQRAQEALVATILFKSIFVLAFASVINGAITYYGVRSVFITLGLLNLAISCFTIPFYIFGKIVRGRIARSSRTGKLEQ